MEGDQRRGLNVSQLVQELMALPNGARFFRCALQVNPFDYIVRHHKPTTFIAEADYNAAIVAALVDNDIEVIAVTDHFRVRASASLIDAARAAGIVVFPGFEACTKDGIHILCMFDPETPLDRVEARIHMCGVEDDQELSALGKISTAELLSSCQDWRMQCIAAHATSANGVLTSLQGQARVAVWKDTNLLACAIPGAIADAVQQNRPILENKEPTYRRDRPVAVLNASDIGDPSEAAKPGTSCWIKMTRPTVEGLRQAFLDPTSRVRLSSDPEPEEHVEFLALAIETAGFLRNVKLRLNENMNVLVGGRGAGKSTLIECLRYVLDLQPMGPEATKVHQSIVQNVLKSGTKISLVVQSYRPDRRTFVIERTVGNPPIVRDDAGQVLPLKPAAIVPNAAVFGQNEISELARSPEQLTALLGRFVTPNAKSDAEYTATQAGFAQSRREILDCEAKIRALDEQLAELPGIQEELRRYKAAGVEDKLKDQALLVREEAVVQAADDALEPFRSVLADLNALLPISDAPFSEDALKDLPLKIELANLRTTLFNFMLEASHIAGRLQKVIEDAETDIAKAGVAVAQRKTATGDDYARTLRELQKVKVDGADFVRLRAAIERLKPNGDQKAKLATRLEQLQKKRLNDLAAWEEVKRERFTRLQKAAKKVSKQLSGRLRVTVRLAGDRRSLLDLLRRMPGGRLAETCAALEEADDLSVAALAYACRKGARALEESFNVPNSQAQKIVDTGPELAMLIEELDLPSTTHVELNVAADGHDPEWRKLHALSTGQKATAMLYLLLIEAEAPLIIDQLEDNLDNRFISEGVVPEIKAEKRRRQFIFTTHNANVPVLGDAELIVGLSAVGEPGDGHVLISPNHVGSIDTPSVAALVKEILEGGKTAFTTRRLKYGF
jgi:energy-coupling factor transporter ATP-binding protein EcfA2